MKYIKKFFAFVSLLLLTSCETREFEPGLQGLDVLFYPVAGVWWFTFSWFTPKYWAPLSTLWNDMWFVALIAYLVAGIVYVVLLVIFMIIALILTILISVVWVFAAILNGIFHFASWETRSVCATLIIPKLSSLMY